MNILYVYAHPSPSSFNGMLKNTALNLFSHLKCEIKISDLYADQFDAVLTAHSDLSNELTTEMDKITWAEHIIFQFPLWWFSTPAILKGWFDRVLIKGFAYDTGKIFDQGLLKDKTASLVVSTQSSEATYQINGLHQDKIETFLHHIHHTLHFVGIKTLTPFITFGAFNLDSSQQKYIVTNFHQYLNDLLAF